MQATCNSFDLIYLSRNTYEQNRFGIEWKHQLLVYADDVNMLGENLQTVWENS